MSDKVKSDDISRARSEGRSDAKDSWNSGPTSDPLDSPEEVDAKQQGFNRVYLPVERFLLIFRNLLMWQAEAA